MPTAQRAMKPSLHRSRWATHEQRIGTKESEVALSAHKKPRLFDLGMLAVAVAVVFGRTIGHDFLFNWDDNLYVFDNEAVRGFTFQHIMAAFTFNAVGQSNPLQLLSYMLDYTFWGLNPAGYHLSNVLIHGVNGLLVYHLLWRWYH